MQLLAGLSVLRAAREATDELRTLGANIGRGRDLAAFRVSVMPSRESSAEAEVS